MHINDLKTHAIILVREHRHLTTLFQKFFISCTLNIKFSISPVDFLTHTYIGKYVRCLNQLSGMFSWVWLKNWHKFVKSNHSFSYSSYTQYVHIRQMAKYFNRIRTEIFRSFAWENLNSFHFFLHWILPFLHFF